MNISILSLSQSLFKGLELRETELQELLDMVYDPVVEECKNLGMKDQEKIKTNLCDLWLPLAIYLSILRKEKPNTPLIQGILGGQGTGKTTLSAIIRLILQKLFNFSTISISIDDLYLTYSERQELKKKNPSLDRRGPPSTHDIKLGIKVLDDLLESDGHTEILIPRFDKSLFDGAGDRVAPEKVIGKMDIILFEGWFIGTQPVDSSVFNTNTLDSIISQEDHCLDNEKDLLFAQEMNERLKHYQLLWQKLDHLIVLYPQDYRWSKQWRKEAEHKMIAQGKQGMRDDEIDDFVDYFWRSLHPQLFIKPLTKKPALVNLVIEIDKNHSPCRVY